MFTQTKQRNYIVPEARAVGTRHFHVETSEFIACRETAYFHNLLINQSVYKKKYVSEDSIEFRSSNGIDKRRRITTAGNPGGVIDIFED